MSALDKLANLRANLGGGEEAMQTFAALSQGEHLKNLISKAAAKFGYADLSQSFAAVIDRCYEKIHTEMADQGQSESGSEAERLERIRMQRNVRHGTFLKKNQFERLFFEADGTIATTIGTLPLLLLLGLISSPKEFLSFRPHIEA